MPERHLFLVATIGVPALLSLVQAHCGLGGTGLVGGLVAVLLYLLWRQPHKIAQAVAQPTQAHAQAHGQPLASPPAAAADSTGAHEPLCPAPTGAEPAHRADNGLLRNVSHELRMQLNAIIGYSEMLQEEAAEAPDQGVVTTGQLGPATERRSVSIAYVRQIHAASLHMCTLIQDLFDLIQLDTGAMPFWLETFDIAELLREIEATVAPLLRQHDHTFTLHLAPQLGTMHADRTKLCKSVAHLLRHASTCGRQGPVTLHAWREAAADRDWLIVQVRNTGLGISPEQIEELFQDVVHQETATPRQYGGTGFRLALSRRLCRMMGGDITLSSVLHEGSLYTLRLPVQVVIASPPITAPPGPLETQPCSPRPLPGTLAGGPEATGQTPPLMSAVSWGSTHA